MQHKDYGEKQMVVSTTLHTNKNFNHTGLLLYRTLKFQPKFSSSITHFSIIWFLLQFDNRQTSGIFRK